MLLRQLHTRLINRFLRVRVGTQTGPPLLPFTYQLKLPATIVGILYTRVHPQRFDGGQILQENRRLQLPVDHLSRPGVECHHAVPMALVVWVTPRDVQLLPRIHQHTYTLTEKNKNHTGICLAGS